MSAVYCLVEKENVEQAEAKLAAYERSNLQEIIQNEARKVRVGVALQQTLFVSRHFSLMITRIACLQASHKCQTPCCARSADTL